MKVLYIAFLILHTLKVVWSYVPVIRQLTFRLTKSTKSKRTPFKSTYGNWENDPYKSPIDPYNDPYQQDTRYNDPAYSDNYFGNNYGWNPSKPARPDVDERAYRDPLYNNDTPKPNKIEYQMGPRSRVKTHYEAGLMQDGDQRGSTSAFTYGPTDQSEKPRVSTSIESPYGTPYGQDETYVSSYDSRFPEKGYYQAGVPDRQAYDYNAPPVTYGPPPSSLTYPDYTDFTFGPGSSIASKGPKPLREGEDPGLSFNGGMLFSEEERRSTSRVSRRGPPMPPPDMPPNKAYSRPYNEDLSPRPFDYGPDSSVNANRFKNEVDYEYQQGPHESFEYSPQSSFSVDGGRRYEPDEPRFQAEEPRESYNYERSSSSASRDYNVKSSSRRTNYDNLQEKEEDIPDLFASRHKISQDIKDLMQKVLLGKRSKVPEVVQGALQARQEIRELLALSKRNLERQISKLEAMIDEMDISTSKVEACMELENLKEQLEREKQVEKDMDMEIGDIGKSKFFDTLKIM